MAIQNVIINDTDKFVEYKYTISEFYMIINGETTSFPLERIINFKIENYFEEATFPLLKLTVMMEPSTYYKIIQNKNNIKFKLRIQSYYTSRNEPDNKSLLRDVINDLFIIFPDDNMDDYQKELKKEGNTYNDANELDKINNIIELFLFKDKIVNGLRSSINTVLKDCTLSTAVSYLLYKAGVKNTLMSPFENGKIYETLVLPPQSIEKQLKYLNNNYGFHKKGTMIYFDLSYGYIINCNGECTAWSKNEWKETVIYVLEASNTRSYLTGGIIKHDEQRYYYNANSQNITIENAIVSNNVINGTDAQIIDMQNSSTSLVKTGINVVGDTTNRILFNSSSNPFMATAYNAIQKSNSTIITMAFENIYIESFTPNKSFSIIFESPSLNEKYKGLYRLSTSIYTFNKHGEDYILTAAVSFKKVK